MTFDNVNVRVLKSGAATELYVQKDVPLMNFVIHLDPNAEIESGSYTLTFVPSPTKEEVKKTSGRVEPVNAPVSK